MFLKQSIATPRDRQGFSRSNLGFAPGVVVIGNGGLLNDAHPGDFHRRKGRFDIFGVSGRPFVFQQRAGQVASNRWAVVG